MRGGVGCPPPDGLGARKSSRAPRQARVPQLEPGPGGWPGSRPAGSAGGWWRLRTQPRSGRQAGQIGGVRGSGGDALLLAGLRPGWAGPDGCCAGSPGPAGPWERRRRVRHRSRPMLLGSAGDPGGRCRWSPVCRPGSWRGVVRSLRAPPASGLLLFESLDPARAVWGPGCGPRSAADRLTSADPRSVVRGSGAPRTSNEGLLIGPRPPKLTAARPRSAAGAGPLPGRALGQDHQRRGAVARKPSAKANEDVLTEQARIEPKSPASATSTKNRAGVVLGEGVDHVCHCRVAGLHPRNAATGPWPGRGRRGSLTRNSAARSRRWHPRDS